MRVQIYIQLDKQTQSPEDDLSCLSLSGVMASYLQLAWGTKYRRFPSWLDTWLKMRKQMGLLMLWLASVHVNTN